MVARPVLGWRPRHVHMTDTGHDYVSPDQLRIGLYIDLELGWMAHPFPKGSFKISSERQIDTIRQLGLARIRWVPFRSDPVPQPPVMPSAEPATHSAAALEDGDGGARTPQQDRRQRDRLLLEAQRNSLVHCDQQFGAAIRRYQFVLEQVRREPEAAGQQCSDLVAGFVAGVLGQGESSIRLLSETMGDRACMHPVNVTVLSLLLGKALGLGQGDLQELGVAAFLHDIGKTQMPERVRCIDTPLSPIDCRAYQQHVAHGIAVARTLRISDGALRALAEHHETIDGTGFPRQLPGEAISLAGKVLALVNRYDNLCNPPRPSAAVTPHEALSLIFSQMKLRYDGAVLAAFIRMMGVYPPGSVVQLANELYALVVSVNSARPLKPRVVVHDPSVARAEALILDLERPDAPGIRRSVKPSMLPKATIEYLSPRTRICYFFERAVALDPAEVMA